MRRQRAGKGRRRTILQSMHVKVEVVTNGDMHLDAVSETRR